MKMLFEWECVDDPGTLGFIRRIPCEHGVIAALNGIAPGELWPEADIAALRETAAERFGLPLEAVSNLPVHEDIIMGGGKCQAHIDNYRENIANLAGIGVRCICYGLGLPSGMEAMNEELWRNLKFFIDEIIPTASKCGVNMALYASSETDETFIDRFMELNRERENGLAMYSSLDAKSRNGFRKMVRKYGALGRVHFAYLRSAKILDDISFNEKAEMEGGAAPNLTQIIKTFYDADFNGYLCPGGGDMPARETGKLFGTFGAFGACGAAWDIARGATYLSGIWETLRACGY